MKVAVWTEFHSRLVGSAFLLALTAMLFLSGGDLVAQDVKALSKEVNNEIRLSQKEMFNGKLEEAQAHLVNASELIEKIRAADPGFAKLKSLEQKYARQEKDLKRRLPKEKPAAAGKSQSAKNGQAAKLPGGVTNRLKKIDATLERGENELTKRSIASAESKVRKLENILQTAKGIQEEIMSRYGDQIPSNSPEMAAREKAMAEFQQQVEAFKLQVSAQQAQEAQAQETQTAQSAEWLELLRPYAQNGIDQEKYLIGAGTADTDELLRRRNIYREAKTLFDKYEATDFPSGKSDELERLAKDLAYALNGFEEGSRQTIEGFAGDVAAELERLEAWLDEQEAKVKGEAERHPVFLNRDVIGRLKNKLFSLEAATAGEDARLKEFNDRFAAIEDRAAGLRKLGAERTLMLPDVFKGAERETIKTQAAAFLHKEYADAQELRASIINKDWQEEQEWEYTDTTKSAVRYRITRSVTTQIAAKRGSEVFLYSIHVAKDQRSDGTWSDLYGHVMFSDSMLEENVAK